MKWMFVLLFPLAALMGDVRLDRLADSDSKACQEALSNAELSELWNVFLKGQAYLYFDKEQDLFQSSSGWQEAKEVLELGSGNGAYLRQLADVFEKKRYVGIEWQAPLVAQSSSQFGREGVEFTIGNAEENQNLSGQFDAVLYRMTLQHLKNPRRSLELSHGYLREGGRVYILDSYDPAKSSSHEIVTHTEASRLHNEKNKATQKGNRRITIEILAELEKGEGPLKDLFEVERTTLDAMGNRLEKGIRFESKEEMRRYFNHAMLFLAILKKGYEIPVDLAQAHEEMQVFLNDEPAWMSPGIHFMVLKKK